MTRPGHRPCSGHGFVFRGFRPGLLLGGRGWLLCCLTLWLGWQAPTLAQNPARTPAAESGTGEPAKRGEPWERKKIADRPAGPGRPTAEGGDRQRQNWATWESASEEERAAFRERARALREQSAERVRQILSERGLELDESQRREFFQAYVKGRRQIERALREQMQQERERREEALIEKLLQDFSR